MYHEHFSKRGVGFLAGRQEFDPGLPAVVCLHGAGGAAVEFEPMVKELGRRVNAFAIDLPGHGATGGLGYKDVGAYGRWVAGVLEGLEPRPVVLGHSMGGAITQWIGLNAPDVARALVLWATGARLRVLPAIVEGLIKDFEPTVRMIADYGFGPGCPEELKQAAIARLLNNRPETYQGDFLACDGFDVMEEIGRIGLPTLVVVGTADRLTPPKYSRYLAEQIPGATLREVEGLGHYLHLEDPEGCAQVISQWVEELGR